MPRGSNPGERRGGRKPGTPNKVTVEARELIEQATADGITPLEYMLRVLRDEGQDTERRDDMAKAAAPYVHPRLNSIEGGDKNKPIKQVIEWAQSSE
jgi:hypothetical protein